MTSQAAQEAADAAMADSDASHQMTDNQIQQLSGQVKDQIVSEHLPLHGPSIMSLISRHMFVKPNDSLKPGHLQVQDISSLC